MFDSSMIADEYRQYQLLKRGIILVSFWHNLVMLHLSYQSEDRVVLGFIVTEISSLLEVTTLLEDASSSAASAVVAVIVVVDVLSLMQRDGQHAGGILRSSQRSLEELVSIQYLRSRCGNRGGDILSWRRRYESGKDGCRCNRADDVRRDGTFGVASSAARFEEKAEALS